MAHAVIPHHHHHEQVCFVNHTDQTECDEHEHSTADARGDHQDSDDKCCLLEENYLIPSNQLSPEEQILDLNDNFSSSYEFQSSLSENTLKNVLQIAKSGSPPPLLASSYSFYLSIVHGLRAPPIV